MNDLYKKQCFIAKCQYEDRDYADVGSCDIEDYLKEAHYKRRSKEVLDALKAMDNDDVYLGGLE